MRITNSTVSCKISAENCTILGTLDLKSIFKYKHKNKNLETDKDSNTN